MHPHQLSLALGHLVLLVFGLLELHLQLAQHVLGLYVASVMLEEHGLQFLRLLNLVVSLHSRLLLLLFEPK